MSTIQVLKPKFHIDECLDQIRECLEKGWTGSGFKTVEFEAKWKEYTGHRNACYLNSNTSGLHLAVNILKRRYGWQVRKSDAPVRGLGRIPVPGPQGCGEEDQ